jgi:hypothetical protein
VDAGDLYRIRTPAPLPPTNVQWSNAHDGVDPAPTPRALPHPPVLEDSTKESPLAPLCALLEAQKPHLSLFEMYELGRAPVRVITRSTSRVASPSAVSVAFPAGAALGPGSDEGSAMGSALDSDGSDDDDA